MGEYTIREHVKNLVQLLEMEDTCGRCPTIDAGCCWVCKSFIGLPKDYALVKRQNGTVKILKCPCLILGPAEAVKRSWIAIEEYYEKHPHHHPDIELLGNGEAD